MKQYLQTVADYVSRFVHQTRSKFTKIELSFRRDSDSVHPSQLAKHLTNPYPLRIEALVNVGYRLLLPSRESTRY